MNNTEEFGQLAETTIGFSREAAAALAGAGNALSDEEAGAISALPSGSALLLVRRGPGAGARFLLDTDLSQIGRHPDADIFLDDVTVSRRHAQVVRRGTHFELHDLGSLNGTYLAGERMSGPVPLADGDELQVGKYRLTFYRSRRDLGSA